MELTGAANHAGDKLPCDLCQGYTLDMEPSSDSSSANEHLALSSAEGSLTRLSLLGSTYLAAQVDHEDVQRFYADAYVCPSQSMQSSDSIQNLFA